MILPAPAPASTPSAASLYTTSLATGLVPSEQGGAVGALPTSAPTGALESDDIALNAPVAPSFAEELLALEAPKPAPRGPWSGADPAPPPLYVEKRPDERAVPTQPPSLSGGSAAISPLPSEPPTLVKPGKRLPPDGAIMPPETTDAVTVEKVPRIPSTPAKLPDPPARVSETTPLMGSKVQIIEAGDDTEVARTPSLGTSSKGEELPTNSPAMEPPAAIKPKEVSLPEESRAERPAIAPQLVDRPTQELNERRSARGEPTVPSPLNEKPLAPVALAREPEPGPAHPIARAIAKSANAPIPAQSVALQTDGPLLRKPVTSGAKASASDRALGEAISVTAGARFPPLPSVAQGTFDSPPIGSTEAADAKPASPQPFGSAPAASPAPSPIQATPGAPVSIAAAPAPAPHTIANPVPLLTPASQPSVAIEQFVERIADARDAGHVTRPEFTLRHGEFGTIGLRVDATASANVGDWRATLVARDPAFVPAVQAALAERAVAPTGESGLGQNGSSSSRGQEQNPQGSLHSNSGFGSGSAASNGGQDPRYGSSLGAGLGSPKPYLDEEAVSGSNTAAADTSDTYGPGKARDGALFA